MNASPHTGDCAIAHDLYPLVVDGIASEASRDWVAAHLAGCPDCARDLAAPEDGLAPAAESGFIAATAPRPGHEAAELEPEASARIYRRLRRLRLGLYLLLFLIGSVATTLLDGVQLFYNLLILPLLGALAYVIMGWRAAVLLPVLGLVALIAGGFALAGLPFVVLYMALFALGMALGWLLRYAFAPERRIAQ